jgi:N-acetylneuraminic acid mutarotase
MTVPPPPTYTIGGTVSGLSGTGLVLQNNGGNSLSVSANGTFTFTASVASGGAYSVTVLTQPSNPAQTCTVTAGTGTATGNVTTVQLACATNVTTNVWVWMGGANVVSQAGTYGTKGTAAPGNVPGSRDSAISWTDASGNFWLFGGVASGLFNDLWKYSAGQWTWISGANTTNQTGVYGVMGTASPANVPGARSSAMSWLDANGNFWLFGGNAFDSTGTSGLLNDLWEYSAGEWTWQSGSDIIHQSGVYGTKGTAAPANTPGARHNAVSWTDTAGDLWLFGGVGYDSAGNFSTLNDLWEFSAGQWTWISGANTINQLGSYGTLGTAAPANVPGARSGGVSWTDSGGNLWLFGGGGYDHSGTLGFLNDLWKFNAGEWTWMSGSNLANQAATYGTLGTAAPGNIPAGRIQAVSWIDPSGDFWLFGGFGLDSTSAMGVLNDLWKYSAGEWTWASGSNLGEQTGVYGTLGVGAVGNVPGARQAPVGWADSTGNLWLLGGFGDDSSGTRGELNDLWEYHP